jgi:hypothetical protein
VTNGKLQEVQPYDIAVKSVEPCKLKVSQDEQPGKKVVVAKIKLVDILLNNYIQRRYSHY